ncbi:MAG: hypothetical protein H6Q86_5515, partial [candidate division NC10 bacterium]|nr:hypothetical protein [candidate division NC10 bacterium]
MRAGADYTPRRRAPASLAGPLKNTPRGKAHLRRMIRRIAPLVVIGALAGCAQ